MPSGDLDFLGALTGPVPERQGMRAIFQKKREKRAKKCLKRAKYLKRWAKMYKI